MARSSKRSNAGMTALQQAEELEDLYNNAPCGYHSLDPNGVIIRINDTELRWLGYTREEVIGRMRYTELLSPAGLQSFHEKFPLFKSQGWINNIEFEMVRKDGSTFPVLLNATAVKDTSGNYVMSRSTVFDLSERKRIEEELERHVHEQTAELAVANEALQAEIAQRRNTEEEIKAVAERYRIVFDSNPLPMWIYDPETLVFLAVNEAAVGHYGYKREEFMKMTAKDIRLAEDMPFLLEALAISPSERSKPRLGRHRTKGGMLIDVEVLSHDLMLEGKLARLVIANDITEKKRLEANLLRSQRVESLGTLAGGIAHDLNNVLSPISMSIFLLRSKVNDAHGQEILETLEEIVERGTMMIKRVLSFAKGVEGERVALNPKRVLREIVNVLKDTLPKTIIINYHADDNLASVSGNPTQLHQVLMNLCVNARDAMPLGGTLTITAEDATLDDHYARMVPDAKPGHYVLVSVRDTGVGIPPQNVDKVFDPFFTTKEPGKGTGLGLATSLGIVRNHKGFINLYSEVGKGTEFKIYLPALEVAQAPTETGEQPEPPAGIGELILVVDDEASILRITRSTLEAFGYRVLTASDGTEAMALYMENRGEVKAVLTDMVMPYMDGAATIRALRKLSPQLPIIASSGLSDLGKGEEARSLGVQRFLPKPYTAEKLLWTLKEVLDETHSGRRR
ncbi:MAG: PAS domain S-box protein [Acidobacteria bacterium]|nr:PAS domain S-box protein [Acidobacteriota bacterium]